MEPECKIYPNGDKFWYLNGEYHREDGPAIEYSNGYKAWYINGKRHREDGPAIERANGDKSWWLNGKLHREDGAAVEYVNGYKAWYLNGKQVLGEEFIQTKRYCKSCKSLLSFTKAINQYIFYCPKCQK